jgi:hypothetical protein
MMAQSRQRLLSLVCLAAIVKNEAQNYGGGIVAYCERILPHVQAAVIVDTGSTDDTVTMLEGMRVRFPWLHVFHHQFDGFAQSRNVSLDLALRVAPTCPYVLLLDADEHLDTYNLSLLARALGCCWRAQSESDPTSASYVAAEVSAVASGTHRGADARRMWDGGLAGAREADHTDETDTVVPWHLVDDDESEKRDVDHRPDHDTADDIGHADENTEFEWPSVTALTTSGVAPQPALRPVCLNFRIECVNSASHPVHRANSGLMNPRVFPNTPHFRFINKIALRWERLLFNGRSLPATFMSRPGVTFFHYIPPVSGRKEKNKAYREMDDEPCHRDQGTQCESDVDNSPPTTCAISSHCVAASAARDPPAAAATPGNPPRTEKKPKTVLTGIFVCLFVCECVCTLKVSSSLLPCFQSITPVHTNTSL